MTEPVNYKKTLRLPKTSFKMKANWIQRAPEFAKRWEKSDIYAAIMKARKDSPAWLLHDGPPYATGDLHVGTLMNKVLKDFVVKYRTMRGFRSPYRPGWDCHGLPIEHKVAVELGEKFRQTPTDHLRKKCRDYALKFFKRNREEFKAVGVFGEWDNPYLTLNHDYEAGVIGVFADMVEAGYVYRALRPVHWCTSCQTALAEAELEYEDVSGPSIYVRFPLVEPLGEAFGELAGEHADMIIWTTTPWTLPANLAIALHARHMYSAVKYSDGDGEHVSVMAHDLVEKVMAVAGVETYQVAGCVKGADLEGLQYRHVFLDRTSPIVLADYVSLDDGTGCVHTAPGHGLEDFQTGRSYGLEPLSPVSNEGTLDERAGEFAGMNVFDADPVITQRLVELGVMFHHGESTHRYPHCWRCHKPVIYRATEQWFVKVDHNDLRQKMLEETERVQWVPKWGRTRFRAMVTDRPDWCISRQRSWGVPIPAVYCQKCNEVLLTADIVRHVQSVFAKEGADVWFTKPMAELLPEGTACPKCGSLEFHRENDIFDVWFESGTSHRSVVKNDPRFPFPCQLYLEGSDQHRGWFQVSMITAMAANGTPPYDAVLTHGFIVDDTGQKMSKSKGNFISATDALKQVGPELFRAWVATTDYQDDIKCSVELMNGVGEPYMKLRNTIRFLLGNLAGFEPTTHAVAGPDMLELDRWAVAKARQLTRDVIKAYETYAFNRVFTLCHQFTTGPMSSFYLNVLKDRMYCDPADGLRRRSGQTAMYEILVTLTKLLAPILVHTCEEVWRLMPGERDETDSVHVAVIDDPGEQSDDEAALLHAWDRLLAVRDDVLRGIEALRSADEKVSDSMQAVVTLHAEDETLASLLAGHADVLADIFVCSEVKLSDRKAPGEWTVGTDEPKLSIQAVASSHPKCARCWNLRASVGENAAHPQLCARCAEAVGEVKE